MTTDEKPRMRDGIIKRGTTYSYVVRERDAETGRTKPRWIGGFRTAKDAKAARDKARHDVGRGTYVAPRSVTVGEYLDEWLKGHAVGLKPSTVDSYRSKIDLYLKPALGQEKLQALSPTRLSAAFKKMSEAGGKDGGSLAAGSVQYARAVLRKALSDAVVDRLIEVNPVVGSKAPRRAGKPKHVTWAAEQLPVFLAAVEGSRWAIAWWLALATGARRGELCALRWQDVDLDAGTVSVERSVTQLGAEVIVSDTKNHERRTVSLDPGTVAALRTWRKAQATERLAWGPGYVDVEGRILTWENGSPVLPDYLTKQFIKDQAGIGLPRMTLHGTRHSHATILLRAGVPVHIVSKRLGHKDPSVTLNVYADAIPQDDTRAVEVFARTVWGA